MKLHKLLIIVSIAAFSYISCGTTPQKGQGNLQNTTAHIPEVRHEPEYYLVPEERYTTSGVLFQQKYHGLLVSLIEDIQDANAGSITRGSVGFYYDKKTNEKERLYLGCDLTIHNNEKYMDGEYTERAKNIIRGNLKPLLDESRNIYPVLGESQVVGIVIGFYWKYKGAAECVTAWIDESDLKKYHAKTITFDECVIRSVYTDRASKIIRLQ